MLNQAVIVGNLVEVLPEGIVLNVKKSYKNTEQDSKDYDILYIEVSESLFYTVREHLREGSFLAFKARMVCDDVLNPIRLVAERISVLKHDIQ